MKVRWESSRQNADHLKSRRKRSIRLSGAEGGTQQSNTPLLCKVITTTKKKEISRGTFVQLSCCWGMWIWPKQITGHFHFSTEAGHIPHTHFPLSFRLFVFIGSPVCPLAIFALSTSGGTVCVFYFLNDVYTELQYSSSAQQLSHPALRCLHRHHLPTANPITEMRFLVYFMEQTEQTEITDFLYVCASVDAAAVQ